MNDDGDWGRECWPLLVLLYAGWILFMATH
jgi:hypothetical protein